MKQHLNPFHIPRTKEEFLLGLALHGAMGHAFNTAITYIINENLARHYAETRTPMHARHYQSYKGPSFAEKFGRTVGLISMNPATPYVAVAAGGAAGVVAGTIVNEATRERIGSKWYSTPYTSGFGSVV